LSFQLPCFLNPPAAYFAVPEIWSLVSRLAGFFIPPFGFSHLMARKPCIHAVFEKTYRRLPCVFSQTLSTAKALFPQVFCCFSRFLCHFSGFGRFLSIFAQLGKPFAHAARKHFNGLQ